MIKSVLSKEWRGNQRYREVILVCLPLVMGMRTELCLLAVSLHRAALPPGQIADHVGDLTDLASTIEDTIPIVAHLPPHIPTLIA